MSLPNPATRLLRGLMVATIALMSLMVFVNVVLRYGFNSSLDITEELARLLFVWLTFLGAISAFAKNAHIGVDSLLRRMPAGLRRLVENLSDVAMLACCVLVLIGSWKLTGLNMRNYLPISEIPVGVMYFSGVVFSVCVGGMLVMRLGRRLFDRHQGEQQ